MTGNHSNERLVSLWFITKFDKWAPALLIISSYATLCNHKKRIFSCTKTVQKCELEKIVRYSSKLGSVKTSDLSLLWWNITSICPVPLWQYIKLSCILIFLYIPVFTCSRGMCMYIFTCSRGMCMYKHEKKSISFTKFIIHVIYILKNEACCP
jgi:hypothetical protein